MSISGLSEQTVRTDHAGVKLSGLADGQLWVLLLLVVCPYLVLAYLHRGIQAPAASGDWAQYVLHAKALVEGRPYSETGYIFTQLNWTIGPRAYPPGLPLTLAPFVLLGDSAIGWMRVIIMLSGVGFIAFAFLRLRLSVDLWVAAIAAMWCGVVIEFAFASVSILSDLGFAMLCWLTIYLVDRPGGWTRARVALVAFSGLAAVSYRVPGIALLAAMAPYAILNWREASRPVVTILSVWLLVGLGSLVVAPSLLPATLLPGDPSQLLSRIATNILSLRYPLFDATAYPASVGWLNDAYHVLAALVTSIGAVVLLKRAWRSFLVSFVTVYSVVLLLAPVSDTRYYWPVYPFILCCFVQGVTSIISRFRFAAVPRRAHVIATAFALIVLLAAFIRRADLPTPMGFDTQPDAVALSDYVREAAVRGEVTRIAFTNPRVLALRTNVPTMGLFPGSPRTVIEELSARHITHVVVGEFNDATCGGRSLSRAVEAFPSAFESIETFGRFSLKRFTAPEPAQMDALREADQSPDQQDVCATI